MQKISHYLSNPKESFKIILRKYFNSCFSDEIYLKIIYRLTFDTKLDLEHPKTFQEKLQWLKLNDRKPIYHTMVDKYEAKKFIVQHVKGGGDYTIPTIGLYNSFEEIDFDKLPHSFILKCTHDSGSYYIVKDKSKLNYNECKKHLYIHWNQDYYSFHKEWPYKGLKSRIIAEPLIAEPKELKEYKFFCFNGEPRIYQTCYDRDNNKGGAILNFYDLQGQLLDIHDKFHNRVSDVKIPMPNNMDKMLELCKIFSNDTYFLRVDFYEVGNNLYCGEFTFYENAGWFVFSPEHWNRDLGDWIKLPTDN